MLSQISIAKTTNHADLVFAGGFSAVLLSSGSVHALLAIVLGFPGDPGVEEGDVPLTGDSAGVGVCPYGVSFTVLWILDIYKLYYL